MSVTGNGLKHLAGLPALKTICLHGSRVTDAGPAPLAGSPEVQIVCMDNIPSWPAYFAPSAALRAAMNGAGSTFQCPLTRCRGA